LERLTQIAQ